MEHETLTDLKCLLKLNEQVFRWIAVGVSMKNDNKNF